ncbi:MAG: hypothetical protein IJS28_10915 [Synergistaceae bacterium]|nr:hypothetical protein [Synergistaceae bacterium]
MKKGFAVLAGVFALAVVSSCAWADVAINAENFPDELFRAYITSEYDRNRDGVLDEDEMNLRYKSDKVTIRNKEFTSLRGIEYLKGMKTLEVFTTHYPGDEYISEIDLRGLDNLESFTVRQYKKMSSINVNGLSSLKTLSCSGVDLVNLDFRNCPALTQRHMQRKSARLSGFYGLSCARDTELQ